LEGAKITCGLAFVAKIQPIPSTFFWRRYSHIEFEIQLLTEGTFLYGDLTSRGRVEVPALRDN
jgi:hypothetical protein